MAESPQPSPETEAKAVSAMFALALEGHADKARVLEALLCDPDAAKELIRLIDKRDRKRAGLGPREPRVFAYEDSLRPELRDVLERRNAHPRGAARGTENYLAEKRTRAADAKRLADLLFNLAEVYGPIEGCDYHRRENYFESIKRIDVVLERDQGLDARRIIQTFAASLGHRRPDNLFYK